MAEDARWRQRDVVSRKKGHGRKCCHGDGEWWCVHSVSSFVCLNCSIFLRFSLRVCSLRRPRSLAYSVTFVIFVDKPCGLSISDCFSPMWSDFSRVVKVTFTGYQDENHFLCLFFLDGNRGHLSIRSATGKKRRTAADKCFWCLCTR